MKSFLYPWAIGMSIVLITGCKQPKDDTSTTDTLNAPAVDTAGTAMTNDYNDQPLPDKIVYYGAKGDSLLRIFPPMANVHKLSELAIRTKDSLEAVREVTTLTDPKDSLIFSSIESDAWRAITNYIDAGISGISIPGPLPKLLSITRTPEANDVSSSLLPPAVNAKSIADGNFFFLGGTPYMEKIEPDENSNAHHDSNGKPEVRFMTSLPENTQYLMTWLCGLQKEKFRFTYGPPLSTYEDESQEVHGIGSLRHDLVARKPALFLTEKGIIQAQVVSITIKLIPEHRGCISNQPHIEFACSKPIEANEILGIWIPASTTPPSTCVVTHHNYTTWTADLNGDGIADLAAVNETFAGGVSDTMNETVWYVNVNGSWEIIDWASDIDCT